MSSTPTYRTNSKRNRDRGPQPTPKQKELTKEARDDTSLTISKDFRQWVRNPTVKGKGFKPHFVLQPMKRQNPNLIETQTLLRRFLFKKGLVSS
ncbi:hypothetical protein Ancab_040064 [Ancistrocladus abbreviatus]